MRNVSKEEEEGLSTNQACGRGQSAGLPHKLAHGGDEGVVQEVASETQVKHLSVARKIRLGEERDCVLLERIAIGPADRGRDGQFGKG